MTENQLRKYYDLIFKSFENIQSDLESNCEQIFKNITRKEMKKFLSKYSDLKDEHYGLDQVLDNLIESKKK